MKTWTFCGELLFCQLQQLTVRRWIRMSKTPVTRISPMHSYDLQKVQLLGHHVRDTAGKCPVGKKNGTPCQTNHARARARCCSPVPSEIGSWFGNILSHLLLREVFSAANKIPHGIPASLVRVPKFEYQLCFQASFLQPYVLEGSRWKAQVLAPLPPMWDTPVALELGLAQCS